MQPGEIRVLAFDYEGPPRKLGTTDALSTAVPVVTVDTTALTLGVPYTSGNVVKVLATATTGVVEHGTDHWVQARAVTAGGETLQLDVKVHILEHEN